MPSVYNYRHVELDKVGRGKRVIKPPGGETADIFGSRAAESSSYSSASSQAGSDVASSRVQIETDQQSVSSGQTMDGLMKSSGGQQVSPSGSVDSARALQQQQQQQQQQAPQSGLLMADDYKLQQQQAQELLAHQSQEVNRSPKKTIPVIRRNPITGEIYSTPAAEPVVRVRQPPGGRSSGIF